MYTPRKRTQYFFPDLPIEEGNDLIAITTETVVQVIRENSNFVKVHSRQSESSSIESEDVADNDSVAIGLNTGIIETTKLRPELTDELVYENDDMNSDNSQSIFYDNTLPIEIDNTEDQIKDGENQSVLQQTDDLNDQSKDYVSEEPTTNFENTVNNCSPDNPLCQHIIASNQIDKYIWNTENTIHDPQYSLNTESVTEKSLADSDKTFDMIKWNEVNNESPNSKTIYIQNILQPLISLFKKPTHFDGWFNQQIHILSNNSKQLENTFDLDFLKSRLANILYENHILITKDGVLKNDHDVAINAANLRLHYISIGDIGSYNNLQNIKGSTFSLPQNLRYLDTIVVTQISPPKLLGIIPLKRRCETTSPKPSYRRMLSNWPYPHPSPAKHLYHHPYNFYSPGNTPGEYNDFNEYYSVRNLPKPKQNLRQKEKRNKVRSSLLSSGLGPEKMLNTVKSLFNLQVGPLSLPGDFIDLFGSGQQRNEDFDNQEEVEFDDDIGIRIIGGNPATSSGTPLSSKGRSAAF
ncbi:unnamed protein product [Chilo suppressalis]|uniref:Uncharacterized protein n=1 Tax=Chilo suppressalis TaxID=168631 RepID=A0ABN8L3P9_CHISP|nr:unnamed protein product [Chilo suppressalis]